MFGTSPQGVFLNGQMSQHKLFLIVWFNGWSSGTVLLIESLVKSFSLNDLALLPFLFCSGMSLTTSQHSSNTLVKTLILRNLCTRQIKTAWSDRIGCYQANLIPMHDCSELVLQRCLSTRKTMIGKLLYCFTFIFNHQMRFAT